MNCYVFTETKQGASHIGKILLTASMISMCINEQDRLLLNIFCKVFKIDVVLFQEEPFPKTFGN